MPALRLALLFIAFGIGVALAEEAPPDLARAEALIAAGEAEAAWRLLAPHEPRQAGTPAFDFLLGIAALESGRASRATFILERVIAVDPAHMAARLEMGRGYFALRNYARAAREFRAVLNSQPSADVRATVARYLERIEAQDEPAQTTLRRYLEVAVGRDTNVAGPAESGVLLAAPLLARGSDDFLDLGTGFDLSASRPGGGVLFGGIDLRRRTHAELDRFDSLGARLHAGLQARLDEGERVRMTLEHEELDRDHAAFRRLQSATGEWSRALGDRRRLFFFGQAVRVRYEREDFRAFDADLLLFGLGGEQRRSEGPSAAASAYVGLDDARGGRIDGDRAFLGMTLALEQPLHPRLAGEARLALSDSEYRGPHAGERREDRYVELSLGVSWRLAARWFLLPRVARAQNRSNVAREDYRRTEASLGLRYVVD